MSEPKLSENLRNTRAESFPNTVVGNTTMDIWIDKAEALEARLSKMERERDLYCQLAVFKDAKSISFNDQHDYGLAIYTLRDLPLTKEFELDELAWAHHAQGNTSKGDWEYFRDEWLSRWREALAGGDDG